METNGKTSGRDSDFRAGAIFFSLTNALLFSFSISCTIVFSKLTQKSNTLDGVNVLAMSIISGIVTALAGGLFIYSLYKLIKVAEMRDHIKQNLEASAPAPAPEQEMPVGPSEIEKLRDLKLSQNINKQRIKIPTDLGSYTPARIPLRGGIF